MQRWPGRRPYTVREFLLVNYYGHPNPGDTDEFGYNIAKDPVHVHDFQATILNQMGLDHEKLVFKHLGRRYRLTDVHGEVIKDLIA